MQKLLLILSSSIIGLGASSGAIYATIRAQNTDSSQQDSEDAKIPNLDEEINVHPDSENLAELLLFKDVKSTDQWMDLLKTASIQNYTTKANNMNMTFNNYYPETFPDEEPPTPEEIEANRLAADQMDVLMPKVDLFYSFVSKYIELRVLLINNKLSYSLDSNFNLSINSLKNQSNDLKTELFTKANSLQDDYNAMKLDTNLNAILLEDEEAAWKKSKKQYIDWSIYNAAENDEDRKTCEENAKLQFEEDRQNYLIVMDLFDKISNNFAQKLKLATGVQIDLNMGQFSVGVNTNWDLLDEDGPAGFIVPPKDEKDYPITSGKKDIKEFLTNTNLGKINTLYMSNFITAVKEKNPKLGDNFILSNFTSNSVFAYGINDLTGSVKITFNPSLLSLSIDAFNKKFSHFNGNFFYSDTKYKLNFNNVGKIDVINKTQNIDYQTQYSLYYKDSNGVKKEIKPFSANTTQTDPSNFEFLMPALKGENIDLITFYLEQKPINQSRPLTDKEKWDIPDPIVFNYLIINK